MIHPSVEEQNNDESSVAFNLRRHKIINLRYKIYTFIFILILFFFWPYFVKIIENVRGEGALHGLFSPLEIPNFFYNLTKKRGEESGLLYEIEKIDEELLLLERKMKTVQQRKKIIDRLNDSEKRDIIIQCININACDGVPKALLPYMDLFRAYILIEDLGFSKMDFNQKLVLKNINNFLLQSGNGGKNGTLVSINFSNPEIFNEETGIYILPINMSVVFPNYENFINFLENIEERVNSIIPIFYKIEAMNYNIVEYESENQQVDINLNIYYVINENGLGTGGNTQIQR